MLIGAGLIASLLRRLSGQQIVNNRLFCMVGIFRHQLFNLLIVAFGQLQQRLLGLLTGATALTANEPAARVNPGTENPTQDPFHCQQDDHTQDQDDHQPCHAGFDVVVIGLDQYVTLVTREHRSQYNPGDQQDEE